MTYTIIVSNPSGNANAPSDVTGVTVADTFPALLTNVTFTSTTSGGATGNSATGNGNINDTVNLPIGSSITYTVTGTVPASTTATTLTNTATVTPPANVTDPNLTDNTATDQDTLTPQADIGVTKTGPAGPIQAGDNITYTITVNNTRPSDAQTVHLSDVAPPIRRSSR